MDSANSGSMQSSDEEYESKGESFTSFLNSSSQFGSFANQHHHQQQPLLPQQYHQSSSVLFNQNTQNLEAAFAQSSNDNTQYCNDGVWSRGLRSQNNHHPNFENFVPLSTSSTSSSNQSLFGAASSQLLNNQPPQFAISSSSSTMPLGPLQSQSLEPNPPRGGGPGSNQKNNDHQQSTAKNPKKRTRASRRAPTTVLNTDTTNFRQMVQEFTGIPAAPFSSSPYSRRLDLFSGGGGGGGMMGIRSDPLYPLRPSAQKLQMSSPFLPQSSSNLITSTMLEALVSATTNQSSTTTPDNLLNIHNQILSFQQPTSLKNSTSKPVTATTANANVTTSSASANNNNNLGVTSFDDLGLNHENVNGNINQQQMGSNYRFDSDKGLENNVQSSSGEGPIGQWVCPDH